MTAAKPVPRPDEASMPFFDGARAGRLMLQRCECGTYVWPVRTRCTTCWSDRLSWQPASGQGVLFAFSVVHQVYHPAFADEVPYNVCLVELDEGIRMYSTVQGASAAELRVGMRLRVTFDALGDEITLPRFVPAGS
jgi:uncharacterized protein